MWDDLAGYAGFMVGIQVWSVNTLEGHFSKIINSLCVFGRMNGLSAKGSQQKLISANYVDKI